MQKKKTSIKSTTPELVIVYLKEAIVEQESIHLTLNNQGSTSLLKEHFNIELTMKDEAENLAMPYETKRAKYGAVVLKSNNTATDNPFDFPTEDLKKLVQGVVWRDEHFGGLTLNNIAEREACSPKYIRTQIMKSFDTLTAIAAT